MTDKYVPLVGGLDLQTPPISVEAGKCREAVNVYETVSGGYNTLKGYERMDGGVVPSESVWYRCTATRLTGTNSHITELVPATAGDDDTLFRAEIAGQFDIAGDILSLGVSGEDVVFVLGNPYIPNGGTRDLSGTTYPFTFTNVAPDSLSTNTYEMSSIVLHGEPVETWDTYTSAEADTAAFTFRKADTRIPLGDGDILGVHQVLGQTLAWREDLAGATNVLSVTSQDFGDKNWLPVKLAHIVFVDTSAGGLTDAKLILGTATAVLNNGYTIQDVRVSTASPALQYFMLVYTTTPQAAVPDATVLTNGTETFGTTILGGLIDFAVLAGGKMESINHNFFAGVDTNRAYFADGVNPVMYYDPVSTALVPIMTGYTTVNPQAVVGHVAAFQSRLIASTGGGGFITSVGGDPITVDGTLGSVEIGVGEFVTGFKNASANELLVFTTGSTWSLSGTGPSTWQFRQVSGDSGAKPACIVDMGEIFAADDVGIVSVKRADVLGGFTSSTITNNIQRLYGGYDKTDSCSTVIKGLEQMRFFFGANGLIGTRVAYQSKNGNDSIRFGFSRIEYPIPVSTVNTDRLPTGEERTVFGSNTGYIYTMDSGTSFDGTAITATLSTVYNHVDSPWRNKRIEAISVETISTEASTLTMSHSLDDGAKTYDSKSVPVTGVNTSLYYVSTGQSDVAKTKVRLRGTGFNVQFTFTRTSSTYAQVAITGYTLRYTNRGLVTI